MPMAYMGSKGMALTHLYCNLFKLDAEAQLSTPSMLYAHTNKSMVCRNAKSKGLRNNHGFNASAMRVYLFHIIAIFAIMVCKSPPLVHGLSRGADENMNYLLVGPGESSSDEMVLRGSPYTVSLGRPSVNSLLLPEEEEELEEILSLKLKLLRGKASAFRVFINLPNANEQTLIDCPEFAGAYLHEPRRVKNPDFEYQVTRYGIGIGDIIKELGLMEQPNLLVTFVPCGADKNLPVVIESVQIELA